jgi:hypothetical protein
MLISEAISIKSIITDKHRKLFAEMVLEFNDMLKRSNTENAGKFIYIIKNGGFNTEVFCDLESNRSHGSYDENNDVISIYVNFDEIDFKKVVNIFIHELTHKFIRVFKFNVKLKGYISDVGEKDSKVKKILYYFNKEEMIARFNEYYYMLKNGYSLEDIGLGGHDFLDLIYKDSFYNHVIKVLNKSFLDEELNEDFEFIQDLSDFDISLRKYILILNKGEVIDINELIKDVNTVLFSRRQYFRKYFDRLIKYLEGEGNFIKDDFYE